ncbi:hypothetical protein ACQPYK_49390 (plasmid) [Streptosporangium sp. CA-135522]|uniref:hypothetical protein n=1 Tax=Streptosporangium sp. CA-135522 TaxID=3240072 RepID=UPI003D913855
MLIGGMALRPAVTEPAVRALACRRLVVADTVQATWQRPYLSDELRPMNLSTEHVLRSISASRQPVAGVITFDESLAALTASVAEQLGVPGYGSSAAVTPGDKWRLHQRLQAAGCLTPHARLAGSLDEAVVAAAGIGYPVVLKPRMWSGGRECSSPARPRRSCWLSRPQLAIIPPPASWWRPAWPGRSSASSA